MAVKAQDQVTLIDMTDAISIITWYRLQVSTLTKPAKPTTSNTSQPPDGWTKTEPAFSEGSTNTLYTCCQNNFGDGTCVWGEVQVSSSYEAAKAAYNKADSAQNTANKALSSTEIIVGTQTSATGAWTGMASFSELTDGQSILYWLPYAGSGNATLNLTLSNGNTTGAIACYYGGTTRLATHYGAGSAIRLVYRVNANVNGKKYTGWWADANNSGTQDRIQHTGSITAASAITAGRIVAANEYNTYAVLSASAFDISKPILYAASAISANASGTNNYLVMPNINLSNTKSGFTGSSQATVYIKGTLNGTMFTPVTEIFTTAQPTTEDGYYYVSLGRMRTTTNCDLYPEHPIYVYNNGKFQNVSQMAYEAFLIADNIKVGGRNLVSINKLADGYIKDSTGTLVSSSGYYASDYIEVDEVTDYCIQFWKDNTENYWYGIYFYDENKDYITDEYISTWSEDRHVEHVITVPANAAYARISYTKYYDKVKLERGNKATDYTPAPEDVEKEIEDLTETVTSQGTDLSVIQGQISAKIWQQDITTAVANIDVGSANLYADGKKSTGYVDDADGEVVANSGYYVSDYINVEGNADYCLQLWKENTEKYWYGVHFYDSNKEYITADYISNYSSDRHATEKFSTPLSAAYARISYRTLYERIKFEKGNIATDYSVADEDVQAQYTTLLTRSSTLEQDLNGFKATVANTYATISDMGTLSSRVSTAEAKITDEAIVNTVSSSLVIGSANLLVSDSTELGYINDADGEVTASSGFYVSDYIAVEGNTDYCLQLWKDNTDRYWYGVHFYDSSKNYISNGYISKYSTGKHLTEKMTTPSAAAYARISYRTLYERIKFERGNIATDYSQAYEDVIAISSSTAVTQLKNSISMTASTSGKSAGIVISVADEEVATGTIDLSGLVSFTDLSTSGSTTICGDNVTTGVIKSINYKYYSSSYITGSCLDLSNGSFLSQNLHWDSTGKLTATSADIKGTINATSGTFRGTVKASNGNVGKWNIQGDGGIMAEFNTETAPGAVYRFYLQPASKPYYDDTYVISSQYASVDSSGNVGGFYVTWGITAGGEIRAYSARCNGGFNVASSDAYHMGIYDGSNKLAVKTDVGQIYMQTNSGVHVKNYAGDTYKPILASAFTTQSSKRYKTHLGTMNDEEAEKLLQLEVVHFDYLSGDKDQYGLYAEDVIEVIPQTVIYDEYNRADGIDYSKFVPYLIKKIQMLDTEVKILKRVQLNYIM